MQGEIAKSYPIGFEVRSSTREFLDASKGTCRLRGFPYSWNGIHQSGHGFNQCVE